MSDRGVRLRCVTIPDICVKTSVYKSTRKERAYVGSSTGQRRACADVKIPDMGA